MKVISNKALGEGLFVLTLAYEGEASPGQFFMVKPRDRAKLLGRPISIFSLKDGALSFLIKKSAAAPRTWRGSCPVRRSRRKGHSAAAFPK